MTSLEHQQHTYSPSGARALSRLRLQLDSKTAQQLGDAERAVRSLEHPFDSPLAQKGFIDARLHIESMANIKMTGKQTSIQQAFRKAVQASKNADAKEGGKAETLRDNEALLAACELGKNAISASAFSEIQSRLVDGTTRESFKGQLRTSTKQVGGSRYHEFGDPYVMPDPQEIPTLLSDLAAFCNIEDLPAIAQAALAHVQLIAIHPFERANGKTARASVQLVLQRRGLIDRTIVPLSLAMCTSSHDYQKGVIATMKTLEEANPDAQKLNTWLRFFSLCCIRAVDEATSFERAATTLQVAWLKKLSARSDSATTLLIQALPGIPVFTATSAAAYIDRSFKRTTAAIDELLAAGVVTQITEGKRNRVFECPDILAAYAHITSFQ